MKDRLPGGVQERCVGREHRIAHIYAVGIFSFVRSTDLYRTGQSRRCGGYWFGWVGLDRLVSYPGGISGWPRRSFPPPSGLGHFAGAAAVLRRRLPGTALLLPFHRPCPCRPSRARHRSAWPSGAGPGRRDSASAARAAASSPDCWPSLPFVGGFPAVRWDCSGSSPGTSGPALRKSNENNREE